MKRFQITLDVLMFAHDQEDAEHLARLIQDRVAGLCHDTQSGVRVVNVEPVSQLVPATEAEAADAA